METPTIAEFFKENSCDVLLEQSGISVAEAYPIEHGFDEMKAFAAYYPGSMATATRPSGSIRGTSSPQYNKDFASEYFNVVSMFPKCWKASPRRPATRRLRKS